MAEAGHQTSSVVKPVSLARGTFVTPDLIRMRDFMEGFFGFECVLHGPRSLMVREAGHGRDGAHASRPYWVLEISEVDEMGKPQGVLNHWGTFVDSKARVDEAYVAAVAAKERFGIRKVMKPREQHWAYSFYLQGFDSNWWEIEYRAPLAAYEAVRARGDVA